jgi:signal transduction histidine kinase/CheY-like chemotaxis protein
MGDVRAYFRRLWTAETGLFAVALGAIAAMMSVIAVTATLVDGATLKTEQKLLSHGLAAKSAELLAMARPVAQWDAAVAHLANRFDVAWARSNIGADLSDRAGFDLIGVIGPSDRVVYAWKGRAGADPGVLYAARAGWEPLVAAVRAREAAQGPVAYDGHMGTPIQAYGVSLLAGAPYIFTASLVQPDFGTVAAHRPKSAIIIAAQPIGAGFVATFSERYQLTQASLARNGAPQPAGMARLPINDTTGAPVVQFQWRPHRPGSTLLQNALPYLLVLLPFLVLSLTLTYRSARRAMARIRAALDEADQANRAKGDFLAAVSHEIRTPLNGVIGALQILRDERLSIEGRILMNNAVACGETVVALINDVLDFSRMSAGQMTLDPEPTDLQALFESARDAFAAPCAIKRLRLELDLDPAIGWAEVDGLRLRQCLFNLVGNAVKFTAAGEIVLHARRPDPSRPDRLRIEVRDTGVGVAESAHAIIFDRFKQADGSTTRRFGGTGLGLAITRNLAKAMGGDVGIENRAGGGSTFHLDIDAPATEAVVAPAAPEEAAPGLLEGVKILVVDDNSSNRLIAAAMLRQFGAEAGTAQGGQEAIDAVSAAVPDVILMDIQMPDMDGLEATRRIRALGGAAAEVPIIALTANALAEQRASYLAAGMIGVVAKPIAPAQLLAELHRALSASVDAAPEVRARA